MARLARVVVKGIPHHVTQRGNARRFMLDTDADRVVYLDLLRYYSRLHSLSVLGYCLMSNHVHLVTIPEKGESLAAALKENARPLCILLERETHLLRTPVARPLLLMSFG